jgi:hypothetical protein
MSHIQLKWVPLLASLRLVEKAAIRIAENDLSDVENPGCYTNRLEVSVDITDILAALKAERNRIDLAIAALEGSSHRRGRPVNERSSLAASRKRKMSAAARARIGAAKKAWWAQQKGKSAPRKAAAPAKRVAARKRLSPEARKKLSELTKARWAARKKAGATAL